MPGDEEPRKLFVHKAARMWENRKRIEIEEAKKYYMEAQEVYMDEEGPAKLKKARMKLKYMFFVSEVSKRPQKHQKQCFYMKIRRNIFI